MSETSATGPILIAYDGSDNAKRAIEYAGRFLAANRAVVVTAWEPMVRQAARMSGLSGVMQPEWVPDETSEDIALTDAKICAFPRAAFDQLQGAMRSAGIIKGAPAFEACVDEAIVTRALGA